MKHVLITGAGSGLGKAIAQQYVGMDVSLCIADVNADAAQQSAQALVSLGQDAWSIACDITSEKDIEALIAEVTNRWGSIDVLVNNAGVATGGALEFEDIDQWQWVMNINLLGMVRMTRACVPLMQPGAKIINIASQAGITPIPLMGSYNASKAAVVSFSETMHLELAHQGIHVSVACPSFFPTNLDKSLRSKQPGIGSLVSKMLSKSDMDANQVAKAIIQQANAGRFMILTHKDGKTAYTLKRFLPTKTYLNMIKQKTKKN
ncbi:SDR family oxidoreductase [Aliiglaciecola sp. M165]|uniref:SDR family oxidoreductase n=1 Tax=Aliiglaciecola sp. M165 TaxID=2593649 RepID=UPI00117C1211|nr:SDR family oxidoreductase [Aliiglaciecola sp. M165]TRY31276.1 SDR family oxidoreductase [Aliiglaciecola sp. M165]